MWCSIITGGKATWPATPNVCTARRLAGRPSAWPACAASGVVSRYVFIISFRLCPSLLISDRLKWIVSDISQYEGRSKSFATRYIRLEVHGLSAGEYNRYRTIIGIGRYIGRLSARLPIIGIGHLTIGIGRLLASADNRPIICFCKQNNKNAFNCSSH